MPTYNCPGGDSDGMDINGAWFGGLLNFVVDGTPAARNTGGVRVTGVPFTARSDGQLNPTSFNYTDQVITSLVLNLELAVNAVASAATTMSLFVVDQVNPPVFSTGAQAPGTLRDNNQLLEVARTPWLGTELAGAAYTFTAPDNGNADAVLQGVAARGIAHLNKVYRRVGFSGAISFVVDFTTEVGAGNVGTFETVEGGAQVPNLVTVEFTDITGIEGHVDAWSRVSRCPRCARILPRQLFVEDGFRRGLLVCTKCYDPPDFHAEWGRRLVGTEREGIND